EEAKRNAEAPPPAADSGRWTVFARHIGLAAGVERARLSSTPIGAPILVAWAELARGAGRTDPATAASEFQRFRRAPALAAAAVRLPAIGRDATHIDAAAAAADLALPCQLAAAMGAGDLVPKSASVAGWENLWRALSVPEIVRGMVAARVTLDPEI